MIKNYILQSTHKIRATQRLVRKRVNCCLRRIQKVKRDITKPLDFEFTFDVDPTDF